MTIFELLTTRPPFDEFLHKDANTLHKLVREGKRPLLSDKVMSTIVLQLTTRYITGGSVTSSNSGYDGNVLGF